jgi:hypothetical protein
MADKKPLWRVIHDAISPGGGVGGFLLAKYARMFRTLADEVAPEEQVPDWEPAYKLYERQQRMATRALLLQAAAEAERGERVTAA